MELKAVALALCDVPQLNGKYAEGKFYADEGIHLGVATSLRGGGLIAPALRDADKLALPELMMALRDLVTRARAGQLRSSEYTDATITVTNLGDLGVETVLGVIYPPQVALAGFGRVKAKPWVEGGAIVAARIVHATLSADHRVTDGMIGARFLSSLTEKLSHPEAL
jgi:pyruvate dehydrogenase E2 component (dihydrolipoamide acetyltransferase)